MPDLDGLELGRVLRRFATPPQLVFVSAYDSAAVEAFELHALDYLRKPVGRRRRRGGDRARGRGRRATGGGTAPTRNAGARGPRPQPTSEMVAVANVHGGSTRLLARGARSQYVQSYGDFVRIVTADGPLPAARHAGRDRAPVGAVRVRARAPPVRGQPAQRHRAAPAARRHRRARPSPTGRRSRSPAGTRPSSAGGSASERPRRPGSRRTAGSGCTPRRPAPP